MKKNTLIQYIIFTVMCMINTSCNHKNSTDNYLNLQNLKNFTIHNKNRYSIHKKQIDLEIQKLKNVNIIYFNFDQYNILPQYFRILNQHIDFLKKNQNYKIIIEGHTDERGTPEYNIALGERRANSIKIYLQSQGITKNQISLISYGKEKPVCLGHNEKYYEKNRRAILIY